MVSLEYSGTSDQVAPWIAVLHDYERQYGRDAWSWKELSTARSAVHDPHLPSLTIPAWLNGIYAVYLNCYPIILMIMMACGGYAVIRCWRRQQMGWGLATALIWFLIMWAGIELASGSHQQVAVIKHPGVVLREGNGMSYRTVQLDGQPWQLAPGVEVEIAAERENGWVQLKKTGTLLGWVPAESVYLVR